MSNSPDNNHNNNQNGMVVEALRRAGREFRRYEMIFVMRREKGLADGARREAVFCETVVKAAVAGNGEVVKAVKQ